jgi:hypothetical protein
VYEQRAKLLFELGRAQVGGVATCFILSTRRRPKPRRQHFLEWMRCQRSSPQAALCTGTHRCQVCRCTLQRAHLTVKPVNGVSVCLMAIHAGACSSDSRHRK